MLVLREGISRKHLCWFVGVTGRDKQETLMLVCWCYGKG